jgi:hypothetical protein
VNRAANRQAVADVHGQPENLRRHWLQALQTRAATRYEYARAEVIQQFVLLEFLLYQGQRLLDAQVHDAAELLLRNLPVW